MAQLDSYHGLPKALSQIATLTMGGRLRKDLPRNSQALRRDAQQAAYRWVDGSASRAQGVVALLNEILEYDPDFSRVIAGYLHHVREATNRATLSWEQDQSVPNAVKIAEALLEASGTLRHQVVGRAAHIVSSALASS
jgi:hypothetical protein